MGGFIILVLLICFEYFVLACGLYFQICGVDFWLKNFMEKKRRKKILHYMGECLLIGLTVWLRLPVVVYIMAVYELIMYSLYRLKSHTSYRVIRGIVSVLTMLVMELTVLIFTKENWQESFGQSILIHYDEHTALTILLMIMVQVSVTAVDMIWKLRKSKSRYFYITLTAKIIMEAVWCFEIIYQSKYSMIYLSLFNLSVILDYFLIYDIEMKMLYRSEEVRRVQIPLNRDEYYTKMEEEHLQIRSMFHDMKNQLMIMEGNPEFQTKQALETIAEFKEKMDSMGKFYHTGNSELDMILFDCRTRARELNVDFDAVIQEGCLSFMNHEDINAIFINAIVNALEACAKIEDGERRVRVQAGSRLNDVVISFKNTKSSTATSNQLKTLKKDKKLHGLGIPSIQRSADKYQGYVSISEDVDYFQLVILLVREDETDDR